MKVAFLNWPRRQVPLTKPSGSIVLWNWNVSHLLAARHEVYVYSHNDRGMAPVEADGPVGHVRIAAPLDPWTALAARPMLAMRRTRRPWMSSPLFARQYYARAARDMRRRGIEIAHVHSFPQAAEVIRRLHPTAKIVVHMHVEWLNLLPAHVAQRQTRDADLIIGCSEDLSEKMRQALPGEISKIRTLHNAIDVDAFGERPRTPGPGPHEPRILFVGRVSPEKGLHVLLDAFRRLGRDADGVHLVCPGCGRSIRQRSGSGRHGSSSGTPGD